MEPSRLCGFLVGIVCSVGACKNQVNSDSYEASTEEPSLIDVIDFKNFASFKAVTANAFYDNFNGQDLVSYLIKLKFSTSTDASKCHPRFKLGEIGDATAHEKIMKYVTEEHPIASQPQYVATFTPAELGQLFKNLKNVPTYLSLSCL